jgi:DNA-binding response OmpR family regulator
MATIMIADDDPMVRKTMKSILVAKGHDVLEAEDGQEAILVLRNLTPERTVELIITDILMPKIDGLSMIVELRRLNMRTKILAVTGGGRMIHSNFLAAARNVGAHDALKKPFTHHQLLEKVDSLLRRRFTYHPLDAAEASQVCGGAVERHASESK